MTLPIDTKGDIDVPAYYADLRSGRLAKPYRLDWVSVVTWLGLAVLAAMMVTLAVYAGIGVWRAVTGWLLMGVV